MVLLVASYLIILFVIPLGVIALTLKYFKIFPITFGRLLLLWLSGIIPYFLFYLVLKKYYDINWKKSLAVWFCTTILAIFAVLVLRYITVNYIVQPFIVDGSSMSPIYSNNSYVVIKKFDRSFHDGDVIVFKYPQNESIDYIKRIIAGPGEHISIKNNTVVVNGVELKETYASGVTFGETDLQLATDQYFVLGDNREHSSDSRDWGILPGRDILGKIY